MRDSSFWKLILPTALMDWCCFSRWRYPRQVLSDEVTSKLMLAGTTGVIRNQGYNLGSQIGYLDQRELWQ